MDNASFAAFFNKIFPNNTGSLWSARITKDAPTSSKFLQKSFIWPDNAELMYTQFRMWNIARDNVYFCPHLFDGERQKLEVQEYVTCAWADLDECTHDKLLVTPSIVWETSKGRYAALWLFDKPVSALEASDISKKIAYYHANDGCDTSGYDITQLLRMPGTKNYKYSDPFDIKIVLENDSKFDLEAFNAYPNIENFENEHTETGLVSPEYIEYADIPYFVQLIWYKGEGCYSKAQNREYDRSRMVIDLILACRREGLTDRQAVYLLGKYPPFLGRIAQDGLGWPVKANLFKQANSLHPHEGRSCIEVNCLNMSNHDRTMAVKHSSDSQE